MVNDKIVAIELIKKDPMMLEYVSEELKKDKGIVLLAVINNSLSFRHASKELRNDKEFVRVVARIKRNPNSLIIACKELMQDKEFSEEIMMICSSRKDDVLNELNSDLAYKDKWKTDMIKSFCERM